MWDARREIFAGRLTGSPAVLVVSIKGASLSALAEIEGFLNFRPDSGIRGVILNRCFGSAYEALAGTIRERFCGRVRPLGYLPHLPAAGRFTLPPC